MCVCALVCVCTLVCVCLCICHSVPVNDRRYLLGVNSFFLPYGSWRSKLSSLSFAADFPCSAILLAQWYYLKATTQVPGEKPRYGYTEPTHLLKKWFGGRLNYFSWESFCLRSSVLPGGGTWLARHPENQAQNRDQRIIMLISVWHWLFKCHEQGLLQCWMMWKSHLNTYDGNSPAVINFECAWACHKVRKPTMMRKLHLGKSFMLLRAFNSNGRK